MDAPEDYHSSYRPGSNHGVLLAGLITAVSLGGAGGLFYWIHQRQGPSTGIVEPGGPRVEHSSPDTPDGSADPTPPGGSAPVAPLPPSPAPTSEITSLARHLMLRDADGVQALLGSHLDQSQQQALLAGLDAAAIAIDPKQPVTDLGDEAGTQRWAINLLHPSTGERHQMVLDYAADATGDWQLRKVTLPEEVTASVAEPSAVLSQARQFVQLLQKRDFATLRSVVDAARVPNERLAALGIIFEEAGFRLASHQPLRTTSVSEDRAWVIAKVRSEAYDLDSEFGLEMRKDVDGWKVDQVNLSRLMREFAGMAREEDAFAAPLVTSPSGGDSLVLFFGYDDDKLTRRSLQQLAVVAALLKYSDEKRIRIGGHADALGEDQYNDALSQRRAKRVAEALKSLGVNANQVTLEAFGERLPLSPNLNPDGTDNPTGRKRNRRAEIYLDF